MSVRIRFVEDRKGQNRLVFYSPDSEKEWIDASVEDVVPPKRKR